MTPATPVSRRRRRPSMSRTPPATRISASYDRTSSRVRARLASSRLGAAVGQDEPGDAGPDELADEAVDGGRRGASPREGGQPLRPRVEPDREPVAGDREAGAQVVRAVGDDRREDDPGRAGREGQADRVGRIHAARDLERDGDPGRDRRRRRRGSPGRPARAPSKSTRWTSRAPIATNRSAIRSGPVGRRADAGPGAGPVDDPRPTAIEVDGRDDQHEPVSPRRSSGADGTRPAASRSGAACRGTP